MHTTIYIICIAMLLGFSAFFSASETAFTSVNTIRLKNKADNGDKAAQKTLKLSENYEKLLSTILIGNNIVNITAASMATVLIVGLMGERGVTVATIVLTILTLVFGEISPKTLAKENPEKVAIFVTPVLRFTMFVFTPFTIIFHALQAFLLKRFARNQNQSITEEELMTIIDEVQESGAIEAGEGALIRSALLFDDQQVRNIYIPRVYVVAIEDIDSIEEISKIFKESGFSRLPVYHENIDNILGVIHVKDFYATLMSGKNMDLNTMMKPMAFVAQNTNLARLMKTLKKDKFHMAVVTDEYGGTVGIVTLEDIIEELVGDMWEDANPTPAHIQLIAPSTYSVCGQATVEDVLPHFHINIEPVEATTVGGWITDLLGHIPANGEKIKLGKLTVRVDEASPRYVERLRFTWTDEQVEKGDDDGFSNN